MIDGETKVCCLIGKPVLHSLSPAIHNAAFRALGLNYVYVAFEVDERDLGGALNGLRALHIRGANVTMPYKIQVLEHLDEVSAEATEIGAVNTILNEKGRLMGFNTDAVGALRALERHTTIDGKKVVLLGAGGAGRAIASALISKASELIVFNRSEDKAVELASKLRARGATVKGLKLKYELLAEELKDSDVLINATPIGMAPHNEASLIPEDLLRSRLVVFDIVYNPLETKLLRDARRKGCTTIDGLWMLVYQGAESFKLWTGEDPPIDVMRAAALKALAVRG